jgi:hypothetical protein
MVCGASYHLLGSRILFQDWKIWFSFKSDLTSAMSNVSELQHLASYVSRHNAMAYDTHSHNEAIRRENCAKKTFIMEKKLPIMIREVIEDVRIVLLSIKHKIL